MKRVPARRWEEWGVLLAAAGLVLACAGTRTEESGALLLRVDVDPPVRTVTVTWRYAHGGDFGRPPVALVHEVFPVPFVPTCVEVRPPDTVYVAGGSGGATLVEEWTLRRPELAGKSELEPRGRERAHPILHVPTASAGPVRTMFYGLRITRRKVPVLLQQLRPWAEQGRKASFEDLLSACRIELASQAIPSDPGVSHVRKKPAVPLATALVAA